MNSEMINKSWNDVCTQVKTYENVDAAQVNAFFPRLHPQAMSEGFLMLTADTEFIRKWTEQHYLELIRRALRDLHDVDYTVVIEVDDTQPQPAAAAQPAAPHTPPNQSKAPADGQHELPSNVSRETFGSENHESPHQGIASPQSHNRESIDTSSYEAYRKSVGGSEDPSPSAASISERESSQSAPVALSALTFENFVIGDSNRMAYSMAVAVAEAPGKAHLNPLFIYGKSGLGKTHLLRAIQNYVFETQPHLEAVYVDSAELLSDFMEAGAAHDKDKSSYKNFKTRYEEADVLLIDDVQFLQGKTATLDIVFQIFNKMTSQGKQVVLSADRAPKNIDIDERYKSRFNSGGTFDIQPPEIETKLGIVKNFIEEYKASEGPSDLVIAEDIQMYIAENSSSNIRELKSAVTKVIYQISFFNQPDITLADVRGLLENHFSGAASKRLTVADIQKEVEGFYGVSHAELIGKKRNSKIVYARQTAMYLCRQLLDIPFNDIAKQFGRDHSTVMYSVANVERRAQESRDMREELEALRRIIREQ